MANENNSPSTIRYRWPNVTILGELCLNLLFLLFHINQFDFEAVTVDEADTKHLVSSLREIITNSKGELTVCFVNSTGKAEVILILIQV